MDSRKLIINFESFKAQFQQDRNGLIYPSVENLPIDDWVLSVRKINNAGNRYLLRRVRSIIQNTDVNFAFNPLGNTPVIGVGYKLFGDRPLKGLDRRDIVQAASIGLSDDRLTKLESRAAKIDEYATKVHNLAKSIPIIDGDDRHNILRDVEIDQSLTGGGFDNNSAGDITKSTMDFIMTAEGLPDIKDTVLSSYVIRAIDLMEKRLVSCGMRLGALSPTRYSQVRHEQDNDGMIGWPVLTNAYAELDDSVAYSLSLYTGVQCTHMVGKPVQDNETGNIIPKARVVDAMEYVLGETIYTAGKFANPVITLARIQKHGYKLGDDGETLVPKDGKARSVYPSSAIDGAVEAMVLESFNKALQECKVDFLPSLQNFETRSDQIFNWLRKAIADDYDVLSADWSGYDKTLHSSILATILVRLVARFFKPEYESWVWAAAYGYCYKMFILGSDMMEFNADLASSLRQHPHISSGGFEFYPCMNGLVSGKKGTHTIGSINGMIQIHYGIPWQLGYEPLNYAGAQAGDDTLLAYPRSKITDDMVETFQPISDAAAEWGLVLNVGKQIFHRSTDGELIKIFLQEAYHVGLDIKGIGTIFRPKASLYMAEYDKQLNLGEQLMAQHARMNQGFNSPFVDMVVSDWLQEEQIIYKLYKEHGTKAWRMIIEASGGSDDLLTRLGIGSFTYSIDREKFERDLSLPIIEAVARIAADLEFDVNLSAQDMVNRINEFESVVEE